MIIQKQHKDVPTAHPPAHPILKRGAGEGCISVNPKLYLLQQIKTSFPQMQDCKVCPNQIQQISAI
jgi:hypothetical protein